MTGPEFAAVGHALALAYARLRPDGPAWLAAWHADDPAAADELHEWELEGHPWTDLPWRPITMTTTKTVADVLAAVATLVAGGTIDLCEAVEAIVGTPEGEDPTEAEGALEAATFDALGLTPDAAAGFRRADAALAVVRAAQARL